MEAVCLLCFALTPSLCYFTVYHTPRGWRVRCANFGTGELNAVKNSNIKEGAEEGEAGGGGGGGRRRRCTFLLGGCSAKTGL